MVAQSCCVVGPGCGLCPEVTKLSLRAAKRDARHLLGPRRRTRDAVHFPLLALLTACARRPARQSRSRPRSRRLPRCFAVTSSDMTAVPPHLRAAAAATLFSPLRLLLRQRGMGDVH